jgi:hypothetical protein
LRSSNKISLTEAVPDEDRLASIWGGVFFHPVFVKGAVRHLDLRGGPRSLEYENEQVGLSNVIYQNRAWISAATTPLLFQYFAPIFYGSSLENRFFGEIIQTYIQSSDYLYFSFTPEFNSIGLLKDGWNISKATTLALTECELKSWGRGFRDDVKNKLNKARREKVEIDRSPSLDEELWEMTFTRKGLRPPVKPAILKTWCSELLESSLLRIYSAFVDGKRAAFRGELIFGRFAYDWIAGADPEYNNMGVNQLLMAEIGSDLGAAGITVWDLVDARIERIADFKRSFGAREYHHWQAGRANSLKGKIFGGLRKIKNA